MNILISKDIICFLFYNTKYKIPATIIIYIIDLKHFWKITEIVEMWNNQMLSVRSHYHPDIASLTYSEVSIRFYESCDIVINAPALVTTSRSVACICLSVSLSTFFIFLCLSTYCSIDLSLCLMVLSMYSNKSVYQIVASIYRIITPKFLIAVRQLVRSN